jgi:hypothetical protein
MSPQDTSDNAPGQIEQTLLRIERLLRIGFAEEVQAVCEAEGVGDPVSAAILERIPGWTAAGVMKRAVIKATNQGARTVERRLQKLVELGALETRGKTASLEYRNTGLLG